MLRSKFMVILLVMLSTLGWSQDSTFVPKEKKVKTAKLLFAFDARRSYVLDNKVKFNGIKIGVELYEKHRIGLGIYGMQKPVEFVGFVDKQKFPDATDTIFFNFNYSGIFYDYVWLRTKRWELTTPLHLGVGGIELKYLDTAHHVSAQPFVKGGSYVFALGGTVQFKIWRWFALGTGGGYRKMLTHEENIKRPLDAPYYQFQVKILLGELYRMAFKRKNLEEW